MSIKKTICKAMIFLSIFICCFLTFRTEVKASGKFVTTSKNKITLSMGKSATIKVKVKQRASEGYTVKWKTSNESVADIVSTGKWKNNTFTVKIKAYKPGTTKIVFYNYYNKQKTTVKVTVKKPWENVKVYIPDTIGEQGHPGNRMKITKYNFYTSSGYTDIYCMHIEAKCVKHNDMSTDSWFEWFYCYDKNDNVIEEMCIVASNIKVGRMYTKDVAVPIKTKYIRFMEYPE